MRPGLVTFDTNVLVYCFQAGDRRQPVALELLRRALGARCILTLQALGEFFVVTGRKRLLRPEAAQDQVERWLAIFPSPPSPSPVAMRMAVAANLSGRFSYWVPSFSPPPRRPAARP